MTKSIIKISVAIIIILMAAVGGFLVYEKFFKPDPIKISPGKIADIETMAELCTVEFFNEVPVKDTINNKVIFAIQKQQGKISFDMENLIKEERNDTVFITLPKEIIHIYESTDKDSYQVIDTKGLGLFTSSKLSNAEDNLVKVKLRNASVHRLYSSGAVARARKEARGNISSLMSRIYRKPVVVIDPSPAGYPADQAER